MKTPVLLLHGALAAASQFDQLLEYFPADQPVYALSFPGHGPEAPSQPFSMALFADAVVKFMDWNDIATADIFGYSMGGYIALHLAATHPNRIGKVVTYGTKLEWTPEVANGMNRMFDPEKIEAKVPQFAQALAATHADWKAVCRHTSSFLKDLGNGLGIQQPSFHRIECPVTIGWGSEDNVVSAAESRHIAQIIPQGTYVELPGGRHQIEFVDSGILFKFVEERLVTK